MPPDIPRHLASHRWRRQPHGHSFPHRAQQIAFSFSRKRLCPPSRRAPWHSHKPYAHGAISESYRCPAAGTVSAWRVHRCRVITSRHPDARAYPLPDMLHCGRVAQTGGRLFRGLQRAALDRAGERDRLIHSIIFEGDWILELVSVPHPGPGPGEVVLEIKTSRLCRYAPSVDYISRKRPLRRPKNLAQSYLVIKGQELLAPRKSTCHQDKVPLLL
jgi:hypothetical protein